jgi:hypothetical protein
MTSGQKIDKVLVLLYNNNTMNARIYFLCILQNVLLVFLLINLYKILPIIPSDVYMYLLIICVSFPAVTVVLLLYLFEVYRRTQLPL